MLGSAQWQHSHGRSNHAKLEKARRRDDILTGAVVVGATRRNTCQYMPLLLNYESQSFNTCCGFLLKL